MVIGDGRRENEVGEAEEVYETKRKIIRISSAKNKKLRFGRMDVISQPWKE